MQLLQEVDEATVVGEAASSPHLPWVILLAGRGGSGGRRGIRPPFAQRPLPQFLTFLGSRSVIRHAADRARRLAPADRIVTVIDRQDRLAFELAAGVDYPGAVLFERECRGTAPELFRALTFVLAHDPDAVVVVLPANHFVFPEGRFLCAAAEAVDLAGRYDDRIILLGQVPDGPEMDYSWIEPGRPSLLGFPVSVRRQPAFVRRFHEAPATAETESLYHQGGLLDTKVLAARGAALWSLGERHLPDVVRPFSALRVSLAARSASGRDDEPGALARLFRAIPEADLHRGLIHPARKAALVLRMAYVQWSDWARLRRVGRTLERFGSYPIPP